MTADEALEKLIEGNLRYVSAAADGKEIASSIKPHQRILNQEPFAVILGCSDSRVPAEQVFDQGVGDLFIVRIAGNIVEPSQIGSIEFACQQFGPQLVVVLGHTLCGAVSATIDTALSDSGSDQLSPNIAVIVDRVLPAISPVISNNKDMNRPELLNAAMKANIEYSQQQLQSQSKILRELIKQDKLKIVGAEFSIETGKVEFYS